MNVARCDLKRSKQIQGTMAAVCTLQASHDFTAGSLHITCRPFQRLNAWFFINTDYQGIVWWVQVEADNIRRFCSKLFISADAPGTLPLKTDAFFAKHSPYRVFGAFNNLGYGGSVPRGLPFRRWPLQGLQHFIAKVSAIFLLSSRVRRVCKARDTVNGKSLSPFNNGIRSGLALLRYVLNLFSGQAAQYNTGSFDKLPRFGSAGG